MRLRIVFDSADTEECRSILGAVHRVTDTNGSDRCQVGLNGSTHWAGETPHLAPWQALAVLWSLVRRTAPGGESRAESVAQLGTRPSEMEGRYEPKEEA